MLLFWFVAGAAGLGATYVALRIVAWAVRVACLAIEA
jgi:hypothetical protein